MSSRRANPTANLFWVMGLAGVVAGLGTSTAVAASQVRVALELPVTATNLLNKPANTSPALLSDPRDRRVMVLANRLDGPDFSCALHVSGDAGRHWLPATPVRQLPGGVEKCYAPEIAFDRRGTLYYLYVGLAGTGNRPVGAYLTTSSDAGRKFGPPRQVLGPGRFGIRMAIDPTFGARGRLHLVWLEARGDQPTGGFGPPPNPIMAAHSDDGGTTFTAPVQVSDAGRQRVVAPVLALGPRHRVHVGYYDLGADARDYAGLEGPTWEEPWSLVMSTSSNGGKGFAPGAVVDDQVVPPERVMLIYTMPPASLVADGSGRLYAAWHDARNHDWDVFVRRSDDGRRWGPARRVNDDQKGNGHYQYLPHLSVAPGGRLDVVFYDRRNDVGNRWTDTYFAYSGNHGDSFGANLRLTRTTFDSEVGYQYAVRSAQGMHEFGGRLGVVSDASSAIAAWTDTRNTASDPPAQDIFATRVDFPTTGGAPRWALIGGGAVVALFVLVSAARWRRRGAATTGVASARASRRSLALTVAVATMAFSAIACTSRTDAGEQSVPAIPPTLSVDMKEYEFVNAPMVSPPGRIVLVAHNVGRLPHRLAVIAISEDFPPILEQLRGSTRRFVSPFAGIPEYQAGASGAVAIDAFPGRYALVCFVVDPDGKSHAAKGMASEFRVR